MRSKLRKITVNNTVFTWRYQGYVRNMPPCTSRFLAFSKENNIYIEIFFYTEDMYPGGAPLNIGLDVINIKTDKLERLSFNKPKYADELIQFILGSNSKESFFHLSEKNGNGIIQKLGYREAYEKYRDPSFRFIKT